MYNRPGASSSDPDTALVGPSGPVAAEENALIGREDITTVLV